MVVINIVLGVPGIVPLFLTVIYLQHWPLASMGITERGSDEMDGVLLLIIPIIGFAVLAWFLTGVALRRRFYPAGCMWFWPVSFAAALTPTAVIILTGFLERGL